MVEKIRVREFDDLVVPPRSNCVHIESEHIPEEPRKLGAFAWVVFIPKQISVLICEEANQSEAPESRLDIYAMLF